MQTGNESKGCIAGNSLLLGLSVRVGLGLYDAQTQYKHINMNTLSIILFILMLASFVYTMVMVSLDIDPFKKWVGASVNVSLVVFCVTLIALGVSLS